MSTGPASALSQLLNCGDNEFDSALQEMDFKGLLTNISSLQKNMSLEQDNINSLQSALSTLRKNSHQYKQVAAEMTESQNKLTRMMNRNMKCFAQQGNQKAKASIQLERHKSFGNTNDETMAKVSRVQRHHSARIAPNISEHVNTNIASSKSNGHSMIAPVILKPLTKVDNGNIAFKTKGVSQCQPVAVMKSSADPHNRRSNSSHKLLAPKPPQPTSSNVIVLRPEMKMTTVVDDKQKQIQPVLQVDSRTDNGGEYENASNSTFSVKLQPVPPKAKSFEQEEVKKSDIQSNGTVDLNITLKSTKNSKNGNSSEWQKNIETKTVQLLTSEKKSISTEETVKKSYELPKISGKKTAVVNPTHIVNSNRNKMLEEIKQLKGDSEDSVNFISQATFLKKIPAPATKTGEPESKS